MRNRHLISKAILPLALSASLSACGDAPTSPDPAGDRERTEALQREMGGERRVFALGPARVIDQNGKVYRARVAISANRERPYGSIGSIRFDFDRAFSAAWGAEPGMHRIYLRGEILTMTRVEGETVLTGRLTETDVGTGRPNLVFPNEPFEIVVTAPGAFTMIWCELPPFRFEMPWRRPPT